MILPYEAVKEVQEFLTAQEIPYVVIGGIAIQRWGDRRLAKDVALTLLVSPEETERITSLLTQRFIPRVHKVHQFVQSTRVLPVTASNGCEVDFSFALPGYEEFLLERSVVFEPSQGVTIRICSAEDLIIHKAVAGRPQDIADIRGVLNRHGDNLDVAYIRLWLEDFSLILETDEVVKRFEQAYEQWRNC
ncbi:MAG: hypothetical protein ACE5IW_08840 [bacterium]